MSSPNGTVTAHGDAANWGSPAADRLSLNQPVVGMASTADGQGYWLVAADGGVFTYGDAAFYGSRGGQALNRPVVGVAPTPDGRGYWLVAADGGVFTFGDARFFGSAASLRLGKPVIGITSSPDGGGYWSVASDGGVFAFGDAASFGSAGATAEGSAIALIVALDGQGYSVIDAGGRATVFGG